MGLFGFGDDPAKEAAEEARAEEERRQAELRRGVEEIDRIFYGGPVYEERQVARPRRQPGVRGPAGPGGFSRAFGGMQPRGRIGGQLGRGPGAGLGAALGGGVKFGGLGGMGRSGGIGRFFGGPRTERVEVGRTGGFDEDFYKGIQKSYEDYYMPQIEEQYGTAKTDLKSLLSGQGILSSSAGQRRFSDLLKDYEEGRRQIAGRGMSKAQQARGQMEDVRADLIGQLEGGMGVGRVADIARAKARSLGAQPTYEPLADIFQTGTGVLANAAAAERAGRRGMGGAASAMMSPFGAGSARVY